MKDNKLIEVTSHSKRRFKLLVSKPTFLIPFDSSRFINTRYQKSQTPNKNSLQNHNNINDRSILSSEIKKESKIIVSKSTNQRPNNLSQFANQKTLNVYPSMKFGNENGNKSLFTKKLSSAVFKIVHRKAPNVSNSSRYSLERKNTNIQNPNYSNLSHSSQIKTNRIFRDDSKILVNIKGNRYNNNVNDHTRNEGKKNNCNLQRSSSERVSKRKLNLINQTTKKKCCTTQNSFREKRIKENILDKEIESKRGKIKSASEKKLKVNLFHEDKPKSQITLKSKSVFISIHKPKNDIINKIQKKSCKINNDRKQFKDSNTSSLLKTKGKSITKPNLNINNKHQKPDSKTSTILTLKVLKTNQERKEEKNGTYIYNKYANRYIDDTNNSQIFEENKKRNGHCIKKRVKHFESITMKGYQGKSAKKENQDNYFIQNNINFEKFSMFVGVCDGHGMFGHEVSEYLVAHLPTQLNASLITKHQPLSNQTNLNALITETFIRVNTRIINDDSIDTLFSGSTCVSIIFTPEKITCANVGDSRAIIGRQINELWSSSSLSRDHKPNESDEHDRIIKAGGRIHSYKDNEGKDIGPERVWELYKNSPGLAMSRSFGDEIAQTIGVIAKPEIIEYPLSQNDKFVVLASDGVWEFIDNEECVNLIKDFYIKNDINGALSALYEEASKRWMQKEEVIDDITAVILFFD